MTTRSRVRDHRDDERGRVTVAMRLPIGRFVCNVSRLILIAPTLLVACDRDARSNGGPDSGTVAAVQQRADAGGASRSLVDAAPPQRELVDGAPQALDSKYDVWPWLDGIPAGRTCSKQEQADATRPAFEAARQCLIGQGRKATVTVLVRPGGSLRHLFIKAAISDQREQCIRAAFADLQVNCALGDGFIREVIIDPKQPLP